MARSAVTKGRLAKVGSEIGVDGVEDIKKAIAAQLDKFSGMAVKKVFMQGAMVIVREAQDLVPVKTGRLKGAILAAYGDPKKSNVLVGVKSRGPRGAPHAHLVEYGHGGPSPAGAHPFFRPAVTASRNTVAAVIAEGLKELVEK